VEGLAPIDLLVNNAGIGVLEPFLEAKPEAFDQTFTVNVKSVLNISQVVAKSLIARGSPGAIVNISSQASVRAFTEHTVYCASKGALDQLTRVMALELGPHKIRVNSVNPTVVMTELGLKHWGNEKNGGPMKARIPLGRFSEISEVVEPVLYLLSDSSSMVHGTFLMVDGGFTVA
jgi:L-xylulose reductase